MAPNPDPAYPREYTFEYNAVGFANRLDQFYNDILLNLTEPVTFSNGMQGRRIIRCENDDTKHGFLFFVRYKKADDSKVTVFYRGHDFYTVGRQTGDGFAYLIKQRQLSQTIACLESYKIRHKVIDSELNDCYTSLESFAQIRRGSMLIGAHAFDLALEYLSMTDPLADMRKTSYGHLYFTQLVCEALRIGPIRSHVLQNFPGYGSEIPEDLLELEYVWAVCSYLLSPDHWTSNLHFRDYRVTGSRGDLSPNEMASCFPVIKQSLSNQIFEKITNMREKYKHTVDSFYEYVVVNHPE